MIRYKIHPCLILLLLPLLLSCSTLPKGAVVYIGAQSLDIANASIWRNADTIPQTWAGRLIKLDQSKRSPVSEGDSVHFHVMDHQHGLTSAFPDESSRPRGMQTRVSSPRHVHLIASYTQSPNTTSTAVNDPPSIGLLTAIMTSGLRNVPSGIIVGYIGQKVPKGWFLCDGSNGTPDLQGHYLRMERGNERLKRGGFVHSHGAGHHHSWTAADTDLEAGENFALAGDATSAPGQTLSAIRAHRHSVRELSRAEGSVHSVTAIPPTILIRYIQAGPAAGQVPKGALVPLVRDQVPYGWEVWIGVAIPVFPKAAFPSEKIGTTSGAESHSHTLVHSHRLELGQNDQTYTTVPTGAGPLVALSTHKHVALVNDTIQTSAASHIPLCISARFIVRK